MDYGAQSWLAIQELGVTTSAKGSIAAGHAAKPHSDDGAVVMSVLHDRKLCNRHHPHARAVFGSDVFRYCHNHARYVVPLTECQFPGPISRLECDVDGGRDPAG